MLNIHKCPSLESERISYGCTSSQIIKGGTAMKEVIISIQAIQINQVLEHGEYC